MDKAKDQFLLVVDEYLENIYQFGVTADLTTHQLLESYKESRPLAMAYDRKEMVVFFTQYSIHVYPRKVSIRAYSRQKSVTTVYTSNIDTGTATALLLNIIS